MSAVAAARRRVILQAVATVPGAHLRALQRISGLHLGTLRHHLEVLVRRRDVERERDRRFARYYPARMPPLDRRVWDALRTRQTRQVLQAVLDEPGLSRAELAQRLRLAGSTLRVYLRRLGDLGLVDGEESLRPLHPGIVRAVLAGLDATRLDELVDGAVGLFDQLEP